MNEQKNASGRVEIQSAGGNVNLCAVKIVFHVALPTGLFGGFGSNARRRAETKLEIGCDVANILKPDRQPDHVV